MFINYFSVFIFLQIFKNFNFFIENSYDNQKNIISEIQHKKKKKTRKKKMKKKEKN